MKMKEALGAPTKPRLGFLPFPVFSGEAEKSCFLIHLEQKMGNFLQSNPTYPSREMGDPKQAEEKAFGYWAYDQFWKWKRR
jgi:hypothetical protein